MNKILKIGLPVLLITGIIGTGAAENKELLGAGATFPYPLYSKMFDVYNKEKQIKINYQSIGSGGGVKQLQSKTVDFGATDAFLTDEELKNQDAIVHIPTCLGSVTITYNIPNSPTIKLTPELVSKIFLGNITKWNDPGIAKINTNITLPDASIIVVHRSDGSGTTFIFTDYLSKVSAEWKEKVGNGKSVNWPTGLGAKGNEGVSGLVKQIPGSVGYCELAYTKQNNMPTALLQNKKGNFIAPSLESTSKAAEGEIPDDTRASITDTDAPDGYPIAAFTWLVVYKEQNYNNRSKDRAKTMLELMSWIIKDGQKYTKPLDYAPLPGPAVKKAETILKSITFQGSKIL